LYRRLRAAVAHYLGLVEVSPVPFPAPTTTPAPLLRFA
jgi:hypothetical protein